MHLSIWLLILAVFIFPIKTISEEKEEKNCNSCHEDHGKSNILVLKAPILEICAQCHDYKEDDFKKMHQGIFIKNCVKCHNPHAGTNDKLIYTNQHTPFLKRQCKDCHIQNNDTTKLKIPLTQICRSCHIEKNILNQESKYHLPFLAGQCTSCHDPHTSENPNILKLNSEELCITGCHLPIRNEKNEHMPVKTRECLKCHLPHQSSNKYLLKILNNKKMTALNDLCQEC
ncbi:hypothetical protein HY745_06730, partial [Candidatus Desantisbacteria bacterium]|nr:hypothetical protein [Candidatus Desantisbacteria bacterium]